MKDAVGWVKDALETKDVVAVLSHLYVTDGMVHATDGRMTAAHPFPSKETFLVSGEEFIKLLNRMGPAPDLSVNELGVTLKTGRFRGTVRTIDPKDWLYPGPMEEWQPIPERLLDTLRLVRPFLSDNATKMWAMCAYLFEGNVYASNNVCLVQAECPGTDDANVMLPFWAIDFISKRSEGLVDWMLSEDYVAFRWSNGAWMRTQLVDELYPSQALDLIGQHWQACYHQIKPEWLEAYERVSELSADEIMLHKDKITGGRNALDVEDGADNILPEGKEYTKWAPRFLTAVVSIATHWQPDFYPKPAPFQGRGIRGLIMGRI